METSGWRAHACGEEQCFRADDEQQCFRAGDDRSENRDTVAGN